jgi:NitT/TauT family transport system ATP-binding protein
MPETVVNNPAIVLRDVSFAYANGLAALAPVNLAVAKGEFISILGPSGCGKSTLLRLFAGLLAPSGGTISLPADFSTDRMAFVFQSPTLMPWTSVEANVRLPLTLVNNPDADARVDKALQLVGLQDFRNAYPRELSGGMQMRASIARALASQPSLLLMDEPFAALDEITRNKLDDDLRKLWAAESLTTLFVTHSVYEAVFLSTRLVVMSARPGSIVGELPIDEPHPRGGDFRTSEKFAHYCAEASRLLNAGMNEAAA